MGIRTKGKIPTDEDTGKRYPITIDHICDREFGGINAHSNFTILTDEDNRNKEAFKRLQTMTLEDKEAGRWIITWVPNHAFQVGTFEVESMAQMQPGGAH